MEEGVPDLGAGDHVDGWMARFSTIVCDEMRRRVDEFDQIDVFPFDI